MAAKETSTIDRIKAYIEKSGADPRGYDLSIKEANCLYKLFHEDPWEAICLTFLYGRANGIRAERKCYYSTAKCAESEAQIGRLLERANARQLDLILRVVQEIIG